MKAFYYILANNFIASVTTYTVWFAITFYSYLETESVFVTGMISGIYLVLTAGLGIWFGSLVDHHRKKSMMIVSSVGTLAFFAAAFALVAFAPEGSMQSIDQPYLWSLIVLILLGVVSGNIRAVAVPTVVTMLVSEDRRDKANGLVGMIFGISFMFTSVISGFLVASGGMYLTLLCALVATAIVLAHIVFVSIPEKKIVHASGDGAEGGAKKKIDLRGTLAVVRKVPGLFALILFTTFNNFLGGVFMSLMDAYGLSLVSVQTWGILWGVLSTAFIVGGVIISKWGVGKNPVRSLLLANLVIWAISSIFTVHASIIPLMIGMFIYLTVAPFIEASEQTIVQKVVPFERQGRVFGFAQSVEQSASPLTAFIIGPLTQFIFIPFMTTGRGVNLIGGWFGTGPARGIALVFTVVGTIGVIATLVAFKSRPYKLLSEAFKGRS